MELARPYLDGKPSRSRLPHAGACESALAVAREARRSGVGMSLFAAGLPNAAHRQAVALQH